MGSVLLSNTSQPHAEYRFESLCCVYKNRKGYIRGKKRSKGMERRKTMQYICHENRKGDSLYRGRRPTRRPKLGGGR